MNNSGNKSSIADGLKNPGALGIRGYIIVE
jgi:hypothetical protein